MDYLTYFLWEVIAKYITNLHSFYNFNLIFKPVDIIGTQLQKL